MIWLGSLLILISLSGYLCDDEKENCITMQARICDFDLHPKSFPETVEGLMKVCRDVQTLVDCILEVRKSCDEDDPHIASTSDVRKYVNYLKSVCDEDNPTFKAISSNFHCVKKIFESKIKPCDYDILSAESSNILDTHLDSILEQGGKDLSSCAYGLMSLTCESIAYGHKCGEDVRRAVEDIMLNLEIRPVREFHCSPEHLEELETFNRVLEDVLIADIELENALKRKRK